MKNLLTISTLLIALLITSSCGGGGSDDSSGDGDIAQNPCSAVRDGSKRLNKILNGDGCSRDNSPVVRLLVVRSSGSDNLCSGTVIADRFVISAAHCFIGSNISGVGVEGANSTLSASTVFIHPNFDPNDQQGLFDVAIVETRSSIGLRPSPLLIGRDPARGDTGVIAGFGRNEDGRDGSLRAGTTRIGAVRELFFESVFSGGDSNSCSGDSGGPFFLKQGGEFAIAGLISSGTLANCQAGDVTRYTRVGNGSVMSFVFERARGARGV